MIQIIATGENTEGIWQAHLTCFCLHTLSGCSLCGDASSGNSQWSEVRGFLFNSTFPQMTLSFLVLQVKLMKMIERSFETHPSGEGAVIAQESHTTTLESTQM